MSDAKPGPATIPLLAAARPEIKQQHVTRPLSSHERAALEWEMFKFSVRAEFKGIDISKLRSEET